MENAWELARAEPGGLPRMARAVPGAYDRRARRRLSGAPCRNPASGGRSKPDPLQEAARNAG